MKKAKSSNTVTQRCQFHFSDGRRCRMLRSPAHSSFCPFHSRQELQLLESQRLGSEISATFHGDFLSATDINHALGKLFIAVAQGRIPARRAGHLAFIGQVLLSSLPYVKQEFPFFYKFDHWNQKVSTAAPLSLPTYPRSAPTTVATPTPAPTPTLVSPPALPDSDSTSSPEPADLPDPPDPGSHKPSSREAE